MKLKEKKLTSNPLFVLVMTLALLMVGSTLGTLITIRLARALDIGGDELGVLYNYLPFIGIMLLTLLFTWLTRKDVFARYFQGSKGNNGKMLALGLLTGFVMNGLCILVAFLHGDIHFEKGNISVLWFIVSFLVVFIQSATEELLTRGYLFYHVRKSCGPIVALILSSVLFSLIHGGNPGVGPLALVNIAAIGLFYACSVEYLDSLWFAMANHAMWNFTQNFLFGLPNSGLVARMSVLKLEAASDSPVYSAVFGVEAAFPATLVCLASTAVLLLWVRGKKKPGTPADSCENCE